MIKYGLGILLLIQDLRAALPRLTQPWYADDAGLVGNFAGIFWHLYDFIVLGPPWGYFLDPTKIIFVVSPQNVPQAEAFFRGYGPQVVTGSRLLGDFIDTEAAQARWLEEKVEGWRTLGVIMDGVAVRHPKTSYAGLQESLQ